MYKLSLKKKLLFLAALILIVVFFYGAAQRSSISPLQLPGQQPAANSMYFAEPGEMGQHRFVSDDFMSSSDDDSVMSFDEANSDEEEQEIADDRRDIALAAAMFEISEEEADALIDHSFHIESDEISLLIKIAAQAKNYKQLKNMIAELPFTDNHLKEALLFAENKKRYNKFRNFKPYEAEREACERLLREEINRRLNVQ